MVYGNYERMKPSQIRFIQESISPYFQEHGSIQTAIDDIKNGALSPDSILPIKIIQKDGKFYSFDNRRLYVFRVCEYDGYIADIPVRVRPIWEFKPERFTTPNDGIKVRVRRGITLPHCREEWFKDADSNDNWNLPPIKSTTPINLRDNTTSPLEIDLESGSNNTSVTRTPSPNYAQNVFSVSKSKEMPRSMPKQSGIPSSTDDTRSPPIPRNTQNSSSEKHSRVNSSRSNRIRVAAYCDSGAVNHSYVGEGSLSATSKPISSVNSTDTKRKTSERSFDQYKESLPTESSSEKHDDQKTRNKGFLRRILRCFCCGK